MARIIGAVEFGDGLRLYFIFDRTTDIARRPLFETQEAAQHWEDEQTVVYVQPANAVASEEPVDVLTDLAFDGDERFVFKSRASRKAMWLTGPTSSFEAYDELAASDSYELYRSIEKPLN